MLIFAYGRFVTRRCFARAMLLLLFQARTHHSFECAGVECYFVCRKRQARAAGFVSVGKSEVLKGALRQVRLLNRRNLLKNEFSK